MACPAGCLNGGGQLKSSSLKPRELSNLLFKKLSENPLNPMENHMAKTLKQLSNLDFTMNFKKVT